MAEMQRESEREGAGKPRVAVVGLASCFGCQLQIANDEAHLLDVVGQLDIRYWQLASSEPEPEGPVDVVVIEGAVTTAESAEVVRRWRERADTLIAAGACATTAGIPGLAAAGFPARVSEVYPSSLPQACGEVCEPRPVSAVVDVDFEVRCCPIDTADFVRVLQHALFGSNAVPSTDTMCGSCKRNETGCLWNSGIVCLGLVTLSGCGAKCVNLGRECNGCRGLSPDANLAAARALAASRGASADFDAALSLFNEVNPMLARAGEEG